jgi:hypothetical protein
LVERDGTPETGGGDATMRYGFGDYNLDTQQNELCRAGEFIYTHRWAIWGRLVPPGEEVPLFKRR